MSQMEGLSTIQKAVPRRLPSSRTAAMRSAARTDRRQPTFQKRWGENRRRLTAAMIEIGRASCRERV